MDDTTETRLPGAFSALIAGLQAGMLGALWMLAWLGVSAAWENRGFWNAENLFATAFYGGAAVRSDFGAKTFPGLALFLLIYSVLGGLFAVALRRHVRSARLSLTGMLFALGWFYLSFHGIWKSALPLVYLLYSEKPMVLAHLIYGVCVGRFPAHHSPPPHPPQATPLASELPPPEGEAQPSAGSLHDPPAGY